MKRVGSSVGGVRDSGGHDASTQSALRAAVSCTRGMFGRLGGGRFERISPRRHRGTETHNKNKTSSVSRRSFTRLNLITCTIGVRANFKTSAIMTNENFNFSAISFSMSAIRTHLEFNTITDSASRHFNKYATQARPNFNKFPARTGRGGGPLVRPTRRPIVEYRGVRVETQAFDQNILIFLSSAPLCLCGKYFWRSVNPHMPPPS